MQKNVVIFSDGTDARAFSSEPSRSSVDRPPGQVALTCSSRKRKIHVTAFVQ